MTALATNIGFRVHAAPDHEALIEFKKNGESIRYTYADIERITNGYVAALQQLGLKVNL